MVCVNDSCDHEVEDSDDTDDDEVDDHKCDDVMNKNGTTNMK